MYCFFTSRKLLSLAAVACSLPMVKTVIPRAKAAAPPPKEAKPWAKMLSKEALNLIPP